MQRAKLSKSGKPTNRNFSFPRRESQSAATIIYPWNTPRWVEIKKCLSRPIESLADFDMRIVALGRGNSGIKSRVVLDALNEYVMVDSCDQSLSAENKWKATPEELVAKIQLVQAVVLMAPKVFKDYRPAPLTGPGSVILTRSQCAVLIACAFFDLFSYRYISGGDIDDFPEFTLLPIFNKVQFFPLQCVLRYFDAIGEEAAVATVSGMLLQGNLSKEIISITRRECEKINWAKVDKSICDVSLGDGDATNAPCKVHVCGIGALLGDFAFEKIATLSHETVTLFLRTESLVSLLFCGVIRDSDTHSSSLHIYGAQKFSDTTGIGSSLRYAGPFREGLGKGTIIVAPGDLHVAMGGGSGAVARGPPATPDTGTDDTVASLAKLYDEGPNAERELLRRGASGGIAGTYSFYKIVVMMIDASSSASVKCQYISQFDRDLNKAYGGFSCYGSVGAVASPAWNSGRYAGNLGVKFLQLLLAASASGVSLVYYSPVKEFEQTIEDFIDYVHREGLTCAGVYARYREKLRELLCMGASLAEINILEEMIE